ncbi:DUF453-domain-containing protein [Aaosphaeria arxii CBS 175.79]|uniref:DUF453-domain-containing protein n=1 Tax=Aaosphaeria arxii CBS 175.79 TaxID=1450172 RepID=A0A6A5XAV5_9PLEO|nr:DUF453-domain-containing protein [Aaosphaeria arxii CBS 175.79]KAF2010108.1 DUF453-domain-containing protein [Aaosphaeria arxii CBS 175.79]
MHTERPPRKVRCKLPAVLMRAGTSKGLFVHRHHLPASETDWTAPLLAAMGSHNSDARQVDGVGGGTSTTSKVAVVSPSTRLGVDVDYTFVQVAVGKGMVDLSGNCGNMCSGVGPFALQEGLVRARPGDRTIDVKIFNTNTSRIIVDTVEIDEFGQYEEDGDYSMPGVKGTGSEVKVAFVDPAGSMTGKLFPTGKRNETIVVKKRNDSPFSVRATLIDAANPFILVDANTLPLHLRSCSKDSTGYLEYMEMIRRTGAVTMGLASSTDAAAKVRGTPKLALVSTTDDASLQVQAFSMGRPHPSLQLTGAACIAAAVCIEGTVAHDIASKSGTQAAWQLSTPERTPSPSLSDSSDHSCPVLPDRKTVSIAHPSGLITVDVSAASSPEIAVVDRCIVSRTARRLFEGNVYYYQDAAQCQA